MNTKTAHLLFKNDAQLQNKIVNGGTHVTADDGVLMTHEQTTVSISQSKCVAVGGENKLLIPHAPIAELCSGPQLNQNNGHKKTLVPGRRDGMNTEEKKKKR